MSKLTFGSVLLSLVVPLCAQDAREIVELSVNAPVPNPLLETSYTWLAQEHSDELDSKGRLKRTKSRKFEVFYLGLKRYERILEEDGKPLSPREAEKQQQKLDRAAAEASRLTEKERQKREKEMIDDRAKERERLRYIPLAYDFRLVEETVLNGRPVWVIDAEPRKSYRGKYDNLLRNMRGRLWIDKTDYRWARIEAEALENISFGLFLAKLSQGAKITFEQKRVNNEVWLPSSFSVKAQARLLVKRVNVGAEAVFTDHRKFQAQSRITVAEQDQ